MAKQAKYYDSTAVSTKHLQDLLPAVVRRFSEKYQERPQSVLAAWPKIIGKELAPLTKASRFDNGVLYVTVKNSTLLSLLSNPVDKQKILQTAKQMLPASNISNIIFRIG